MKKQNPCMEWVGLEVQNPASPGNSFGTLREVVHEVKKRANQESVKFVRKALVMLYIELKGLVSVNFVMLPF